jgi:hypothetical protein
MAIEWYNENANRTYPLDEDVSKVGLYGGVLPDDILVDIVVAIPWTLADTLYVSGVTITPLLMSVSIASTTAGGLLAVSALKEDDNINRALIMDQVTPGISGMVAFGPGVLNHSALSLRFNSLAQSQLTARAARISQAGPVPTIGLFNGSPDLALSGVIDLEAGPDINIFREGQTVVFELAAEVRQDFLGPCDSGAATDSCGRTPIRKINTVPPDVDGVITIEVE